MKSCIWSALSILFLASAASAQPGLRPRPTATRPAPPDAKALFQAARKLTAGGVPERRKGNCLRRIAGRCRQWGRTLVVAKIAPQHAAMLKQLDRYLATKPQGRLLAAVLLYKGLIYYYYGHEDKALPLLLRVATELKAAAPAAARRAAHRVLQIFQRKQSKTKLHLHLKRFLADQQLMADKSFAARMHQFELVRRWEIADKLRKQGNYAKCGDMFSELGRRSSTHPQIAAMLFNAAACYEAAGLLGKSIQMWRLLVDHYSKSKFTPIAMLYMAGNYHTMFFPDLAAQWYERFARQYLKRKEAPDALMWAIVLRSGLLQTKAVERLVKLFIRTYSRRARYRSDVAKAAWMLVKLEEEYGSQAAFIRRLRWYLKSHARTGPVDKQIEALAKIGQLAWERSCKVMMTNGLCLRVRFYRKRGSKKKFRRLIYLTRDPRHVATAKRYFAQALGVWANGRALLKIPKHAPVRVEQVRNARHHAAQAMFMQAEFDLEKSLRKRAPAGLDFDPLRPAVAKRSQARFQKWIQERTLAAGRLIGRYMQALTKVRALVDGKKRGDPDWAIAAVSRTGMLYQAFGDALLDMPVPKALRSTAAKDAFREATHRYTKPLLKQAEVRYRICRRLANMLRWYNEWANQCDVALQRLDPAQYPLGLERYRRPGYYATGLDPAGFQ
ncbi:MAG: hypothetical protein ABI333_21295 [bacterium]